LRVDPRVRQYVLGDLAKTGEELADGVFADWDVVPRTPQMNGILSFNSTLVGNSLWCSMSLDLNAAVEVRAALCTPEGLPITFDWTSRRNKQLQGTLPLALSLAKRMSPELEVESTTGKVTNRSPMSPLTIRYVQAGDSFVELTPAIVVPSGQSALLPLPDAKDRNVRIPPEAVEYVVDIAKMFAEFVEAPRQNLETVEIVNEFDLLDPRRGEHPADLTTATLDHVEVSVSYQREGDPGPQQSPPRCLSPRGSSDDHIRIPFLLRGDGKRTVTVKGTAYYGPGGDSGAASFVTSTSSLRVILNQSLLPTSNRPR
jgi:hypothetical protein